MQIPTLSNTLQAGLSGINQGLDGVQKAATDIAGSGQVQDNSEVTGQLSSSQATVSLEESLVELMASENEVAASVQAVTTADEILGTLIDTRA
jgi:flagellar hook protein FlgE